MIPGVPDAIPRKRYIEVIETLGLDPSDLISLEFKRDGIYAEMYARTEDGKAFRVEGEEFVMNSIYIPVTDTEDEPAQG